MAILYTCFRFEYDVFRRKIISFEAVNRKNNFQEVLDSTNDGTWTVHGEEIAFSLTDFVCYEPTVKTVNVSQVCFFHLRYRKIISGMTYSTVTQCHAITSRVNAYRRLVFEQRKKAIPTSHHLVGHT